MPPKSNPTVPEGHKHRVTTPENPRKIPRAPAEPRRDPAELSERPRGALSENPAEPSERQISSESLAEGCAPRMVTLRNFKNLCLPKVMLQFGNAPPSGSESTVSRAELSGGQPKSVSGPQKGPTERGHVKKRQKSSRSVKYTFDTFRHFSRRAKNVKSRQKVSKTISTLFDNFRAAPVFRPLLGSSESVSFFCWPPLSSGGRAQWAPHVYRVWGCKAGRHKRSSSEATADISKIDFSGNELPLISGKTGNR